MRSKRLFDLTIIIISLPISLSIGIFIAILVKITSKGDIIFWSERVGLNRKTFMMPKFRTMSAEAPNIATHLMDNPTLFYTPIGKILRSISLDELPQLWSILTGKMTFVGPRPALYNQYDLIQLREERGLNQLVPGLTGWAQINGRDENSILEKVVLDEFHLKDKSLLSDIYILFHTFVKVLKKDNISH